MSAIHLLAAEETKERVNNLIFDRNKLIFFCSSVMYSKTIIYLSVGESGGYLPSGEAAW